MWELSATAKRRTDGRNNFVPPDVNEEWFQEKYGDNIGEDYHINFGGMIRFIECTISRDYLKTSTTNFIQQSAREKVNFLIKKDSENSSFYTAKKF